MDDCTNVDGYRDGNRVVPVTTFPFAGRKNMEHEVRNVRVRNRVGVSLLDL